MADVVSPLSNEPIVDPITGMPTRRFFAWLSQNTSQSNDSNIVTATASDQLQPTAAIGSINKRLDDIELQLNRMNVTPRSNEDGVDIISYTAEINELRKRVRDLEIGA